MASTGVIVVAAGRGTRAGTADGQPKQFQRIAGKAVLQYAIDAFLKHPRIDCIIPVIHGDDAALFSRAVQPAEKVAPPVFGGATRQQSVMAGLQALNDREAKIVLIHDGARPFISAETIDAVLDAVRPGCGAVPALPLVDTVKHGDNEGRAGETLDRTGLFHVQTPQGFMFDDIYDAHQAALRADGEAASDDSSIAQQHGIDVHLVSGSRFNFKITTREDLELASMLKAGVAGETRVGNGYDVHALAPGKGVVLCGVPIECEWQLVGHSDADVGLHAITDALLGAISAGDIGAHFPPSDEQWRGASSDRFLAYAGDLVSTRNGIISSVDVTMICESPKIGPRRDEMRARIAEILDIDIDRVSVKATTSERLGFVGRSEGIAALATATVRLA